MTDIELQLAEDLRVLPPPCMPLTTADSDDTVAAISACEYLEKQK